MFTVFGNTKEIVPIPYNKNQEVYISNSGEPSNELHEASFPPDLTPSSYMANGDSVIGKIRYNNNRLPTSVVECSRKSDATYVIVRVPDYTR